MNKLKPYSRLYVCEHCGREFQVDSTQFAQGVIQRRRYCGDDCRKTARRLKSQRTYTCQNKECGKSFTASSAKAKWCSSYCRQTGDRDAWRRRAKTQRNKIYNLQDGEYEKMHKYQDGRCAICRLPETQQRNGRVKLLSVDHCHETGRTRALLCARCNLMLGNLMEHPGLFDNMLDYLVFHKLRDSPKRVTEWTIECPSLYFQDQLT
jgi:hypothetical protein